MSLSNSGPDVLDTGLKAFISQSKKNSFAKVPWLVTGSSAKYLEAGKEGCFQCRAKTLIFFLGQH